jgi:PAS domain S-box-containing protein
VWQSHPFFLLNVIASLIAAACVIVAWRRRPTTGAAPLASLMAGVAIWCFASAFGLVRADLAGQLFWANASYLGVGLVPASWFLFALQYTDHPLGHSPRTLRLLAIEPLLVLLLIATDGWHGLFRSDVQLGTVGGLAMLDVVRGPAFWLHTLYAYLLLALGSLLLLRAFVRMRELYRQQTGALLLGVAAPWVANSIYLSGLSPLPLLDLTPLGFLVSGIALIWDLRHFRLLNILPVARDTLIEQMSDGVVVLDARNHVVDLNAAARHTLGKRGTHAIGMPAAQLFAAWPRLLERYGALTGDVAEEVTLAEGDGVRVYDLRITTLHDRRGVASGRLIVWHEITARTMAEERLRRLNERMLLHVQKTPLGYVEWDSDVRVVIWNSAAERIFGYSADEVIGKRVIDLIVPERIKPYIHQLRGDLQEKRGGTRSTNINCTKDGREIICDWYNTIFTEPSGAVTGWASLVEDITERVETARALEAANRAKSQFLASMSHELRTPLNAILGYMQLLRRETQLSDFSRDALGHIEQSGEHLLVLITDLLDMAKIEAGIVELVEGQLYLPSLLDDLVAGAQLQAERKNLGFRFVVEPGGARLPLLVRADGRRLRQVLLNLLSNAVKFTEVGTVSLAVRFEPVAAHDNRWRLRFAVTDTGVGIAPADLARILEPFQQAGALAARVDGAGLGLAICAQLLRLMGSELQVQSAPSAGSRFGFELQLDADAAAPGSFDGAGRTALLVGREGPRRARLRRQLLALDFALLEAPDRQQGLAMARGTHPELLVLLAGGPELDIPTMIGELRRDPGLARSRLLCLANDSSLRQASLVAGANTALALPLSDGLLADLLQHLLGPSAQSPLPAAPAADGQLSPATTLMLPAADEVGPLLDLLVVGDLRALRQQAAQLGVARPQLTPFSDEVERLASGFQIDTLRDLLRAALPESVGVREHADAG